MEEEVKVHGSWASPFSHRVIWALRLKHIPYHFIQEDMANKSPLLLHYNPVYKKIPVLVHAGNPICESAVILEYIDDAWPENPLLPSDPFDRATARFWIKFIQDKEASFRRIFTARVEEREEARKESLEVLRTMEEQGLGDGKFFGGEKINMVDLVYGWIAVWMKVFEEVMDMKLIDQGLEFPRLQAWMENFKASAVISDHIPDHHRMVLHLRRQHELLRSPPN